MIKSLMHNHLDKSWLGQPRILGQSTWRRAIVLAMLCLAGVCASGCREHPQVTSAESLEFIKQVYTACSTKNSTRLAACRSKLNSLVAAGELSEAEAQSFSSIISTAEAGDWESAQRSSLQFARDQVR